MFIFMYVLMYTTWVNYSLLTHCAPQVCYKSTKSTKTSFRCAGCCKIYHQRFSEKFNLWKHISGPKQNVKNIYISQLGWKTTYGFNPLPTHLMVLRETVLWEPWKYTINWKCNQRSRKRNFTRDISAQEKIKVRTFQLVDNKELTFLNKQSVVLISIFCSIRFQIFFILLHFKSDY